MASKRRFVNARKKKRIGLIRFEFNIPQGPCRVASNPEREGFVRPARAAFSSTVSRRRRASACSDASTSFEPCRQVVDVLETTGRQLSSWHINTPGLSRRLVATPSNLLVPPIRISHVIAHFVFSLSFFLFFYSTRLSSRSHDQSLLQKEKKNKKILPRFQTRIHKRRSRSRRGRSILRLC